MGSELDFAKFCFHAGFGMNISCPNCLHFPLSLLNRTQGSHGLCGSQRPPCSGRQRVVSAVWVPHHWAKADLQRMAASGFSLHQTHGCSELFIQSRASNFESLAHGWRTTYPAVNFLCMFSTWLLLWKKNFQKRGEVSCIHLNHLEFQLFIFGGAAAIQVGCSYQLVRFKSSFCQGAWPHKRGIGYTRCYKLTSFVASF